MAKELETTPIENLKKNMRDVGYSRELADAVGEEADTIEPGRERMVLQNVIYIAVMPDDSGSIGGDNPLERDNTQDVIDGRLVEGATKLQLYSEKPYFDKLAQTMGIDYIEILNKIILPVFRDLHHTYQSSINTSHRFSLGI